MRSSRLTRTKPKFPPDPLSPRERQVLQLIAEGKTTKEVASRLGHQCENRGNLPHPDHGETGYPRDREFGALRGAEGCCPTLGNCPETSKEALPKPCAERFIGRYAEGMRPCFMRSHTWFFPSATHPGFDSRRGFPHLFVTVFLHSSFQNLTGLLKRFPSFIVGVQADSWARESSSSPNNPEGRAEHR